MRSISENEPFFSRVYGHLFTVLWTLWIVAAAPFAWASCAVWFKLQSFLHGGLKQGPMARSVDLLPLAGRTVGEGFKPSLSPHKSGGRVINPPRG